ncbi:hypothetical protein [Actinoplanes sp. NPDC089786]|uniref:hypothetical protein n=1 Tax=Actinoplanes sp. NPDC089786 TaxID=3155185 RepID=UPI00341FD5AF
MVRLAATIGSTIALDLLSTAAGDAGVSETLDVLAPALDEGLLVFREAGIGAEAVSFRHDRVQQAAMGDDVGGPIDRLAVARRLTAIDRFRPEAVEQYLAAWPSIESSSERCEVATMFDAAAAEAVRVSNYGAAERLLRAACSLTDGDGAVGRRIAWQRTLYLLGRLDEAAEVYAGLVDAAVDPVSLIAATGTQIDSLLNGSRPVEALALGLDWLSRLGLPMPAENAGAEVDRGLADLRMWIDGAVAGQDRHRPEPDDPQILAALTLFTPLMTTAFFIDNNVYNWLAMKAFTLWRDHGPHSLLIAPLACASSVFQHLREDYRTCRRRPSAQLASPVHRPTGGTVLPRPGSAVCGAQDDGRGDRGVRRVGGHGKGGFDRPRDEVVRLEPRRDRVGRHRHAGTSGRFPGDQLGR